MNVINKLKLILISAIFFFYGCHQQEDQLIPKDSRKFTAEQIPVDQHILDLLNSHFSQTTTSGRIASELGLLELEQTVRTYSPRDSITRYAFDIESTSNSLSFDNFILKEKEGEVTGYYITYNPDLDWLVQFDSDSIKWSEFTGKIVLSDPTSNKRIEEYLVNGLPESQTGGRLESDGCCTITASTTNLGTIYMSIVCEDGSYGYYFARTQCGGGSPDGGSSSSGGTSGGSNSGGSTGGLGGTSGGGSSGSGSSGSSSGRPTDLGDVDPDPINPIGVITPDPKILSKEILAELWEEKIDDSQLKPCMQTIMADLKNLTTGVGQIVVNFSGNTSGYNWKAIDGTLPAGTAATDPPALYNNSTGTITTTFDSQAWLNATELSWARTMLHEAVHADLVVYFAINKPGWIATYPQMVAEWGRLQNWNDVHHEEMARSIVSEISKALKEYGVKKGYNLNQQFYDDMAWAGLHTTSTFSSLSPKDQTRIKNVIAVELTGQDTNGNTVTQKGSNAGC